MNDCPPPTVVESLPLGDAPKHLSGPLTLAADHQNRLRRAVEEYFDRVWRLLRGLGLPDADAEEEAQRTFVVLSQKLDSVHSGCELAFLAKTALGIAANRRRINGRCREDPMDPIALPNLTDDRASPHELLTQKEAQALLFQILNDMPANQREVFILFELEEWTAEEIATQLDIPTGTVASRLHAARDLFHRRVKVLQARIANEESRS